MKNWILVRRKMERGHLVRLSANGSLEMRNGRLSVLRTLADKDVRAPSEACAAY
jgi:hypothetical protein